ncbi:MAG: ATP-binding cassette domain-containing protein [Deltaproteobacteria bacterium]|nr:ATP-binding cassette domain-containing protein [Deltaproteobacteria bacterium]
MNYIIQAQNLVKKYGHFEAVKGIDFNIPKASCFGFLGPNGAGKTTTMSMLYCFVRVTSGSLSIAGLTPPSDEREIKKILGIVPQDNNLDPDLSVFENLVVYARYYGLSLKQSKNKIEELLDFFELGEKRNVRIPQLSGGMKRRLVLARALLHDPKIIILDEPTTGLDPQARHLIWERLESLKKTGKTFVLTTHYMDEAERLCDELVLMDQGKILEQNTPHKLIEKHIGKETIEIIIDNQKVDSILDHLSPFKFTWEKTSARLFIYTHEGHKILEKLIQLNNFEFLHRRSSLEDVFLKLTGRELRE